MDLWLVPIDERSFQRTLAEPVDLSDWESRLDSFPETARVWASGPTPNRARGNGTAATSSGWSPPTRCWSTAAP